MKNKRTILIVAVLLLAAGILLAVLLADTNPVVRLEIIESSLELKTGEYVRLHVKGYTADGKEALAEQMEKLALRWCVHADNVYICTVDDDGILTALSPGVVNVQVYCEKNGLYSRSITVSIKEE